MKKKFNLATPAAQHTRVRRPCKLYLHRLIGSGCALLEQGEVEMSFALVKLAYNVTVVDISGGSFARYADKKMAQLGGQVAQGEHRQHVAVVQEA